MKKNKINIKYLKENKLYDAHKHFMRLSEAYIQLPEELEEDDDTEPQDGTNGGMGTGMGDAQGNAAPDMGGDLADQNTQNDEQGIGGVQNDPSGADIPMSDDSQDMNGNIGDGADMNAPMDGGLPMEDQNMIGDADSALGDDEEVIDVDSLTNAQEKLNLKQNHVGADLGKVDSKITQLLDTIESLNKNLANQNDEIEKLKAEFQKRNPTSTERLNLRSLDSYPFNIKPTEYWKKQAESGKYDPYSDNGEPTTQEYEITNNDVDNPTRNIADTFFKIDDDDIQDINKIFGL